MVELVIGLAITGVLLAMGGSTFSSWIRNSKVRTTAESIQVGLQFARAEAVRRNTLVRFQLTTTATNESAVGAGNGCQIQVSGVNWVISQDDPTNLCGAAPSDSMAPRIIQTHSAAEGSGNAAVTAVEVDKNNATALTPAFSGTVMFNGLGRVSAATLNAGNSVNINVSYSGGTCAVAGGNIRCLRVVATSGGQIRMCDPKLPSTDAQGC